jgi:hypothetical protein
VVVAEEKTFGEEVSFFISNFRFLISNIRISIKTLFRSRGAGFFVGINLFVPPIEIRNKKLEITTPVHTGRGFLVPGRERGVVPAEAQGRGED